MLLREHGLPCSPCAPAGDGEDSVVFLAPEHAVKLRKWEGLDYRQEAANAARARALGVSAPRCVAATEDWSIWERLSGTNVWKGPDPTAAAWAAILADLGRLHAVPAPANAKPMALGADPLPADVMLTKGQVGEADAATLDEILSYAIAPRRLVLAHGDPHGGNIIIDDAGGYVGLIDWSGSGWWPVERDYALLDEPGFRLAHSSAPRGIDWRLVCRLRAATLIRLVAGRICTPHDLRPAIDLWRRL